MIERTFVDSNVLIYAHDVDAGTKHRIANSLLRQLWESRTGVLSVQVLQEFYANITHKVSKPISRTQARMVVDEYSRWSIETTPNELSTAFRIEDEARINFWDALIIASALKRGATRILSEDLKAGQRIAGIVIENPFVLQ